MSHLVLLKQYLVLDCLNGMLSRLSFRRGAEGVGRATTNAVVSASILILISNYLVTALF